MQHDKAPAGTSDRNRSGGESGMTMIVVTREMDFARTVADEMVFVDDGRIIESALRDAFFSTPKSGCTKLFLSQILSH